MNAICYKVQLSGNIKFNYLSLKNLISESDTSWIRLVIIGFELDTLRYLCNVRFKQIVKN